MLQPKEAPPEAGIDTGLKNNHKNDREDVTAATPRMSRGTQRNLQFVKKAIFRSSEKIFTDNAASDSAPASAGNPESSIRKDSPGETGEKNFVRESSVRDTFFPEIFSSRISTQISSQTPGSVGFPGKCPLNAGKASSKTIDASTTPSVWETIFNFSAI